MEILMLKWLRNVFSGSLKTFFTLKSALFQHDYNGKLTMFHKTIIATLIAFAPLAHALDIQRWHTPHGSEVLLVERHQLPMVDYAVIFKNAGAAAEPSNKSNIAAATAELLTSGTTQLNEEEFNQAINDLGASLNGTSSSEFSSFAFRTLSRPDTLAATANLLNQALTQPRFDPEVLQRVKDQASLSLKQSESYPSFIADREMARLNYPTHPYGKTAFQTVEKIQSVQPADLKEFHRQHYAKNNAIVAIVGDVNRQQAEQLVEQTLRGLPEKAQHTSSIPPVIIQPAQHKNLPFPHSTQDTIVMGLPILTADSPDYFAMLVGNYVLGGGGFDSRLMKKLRDEKGYTYGASSRVAAYKQAAPFTIEFSTERTNRQAALQATQQVLADFITNGVTEEELTQAKANITGSFPLRLDSNAKLLSNLTSLAYYNRPNDWLDTYNDKINALTTEDIKRAWQRNLSPEKLNIVIVGGE